MDCQNCPLKDQLAELRDKYSTSRKDIYRRLEELETNTAVTDERYKNIVQDLTEMKAQLSGITARLDQLTQQPAKRWDAAVTGCITAIIGAIIGFVGPKLLGG